MLNPYGETHRIHGYTVTVYQGFNDTIDYFVGNTAHTATIRLCKWARGLHGNPPSGTQYGSARIILPNGERVSLPIYV